MNAETKAKIAAALRGRKKSVEHVANSVAGHKLKRQAAATAAADDC